MVVLHWSLRNRWKTVGRGCLAFVLTLFAFGTLPFTFQPTMNTDDSQVNIELPPGSTLKQTATVTDSGSDLLRSQQEVKDAFSDINVGQSTIYLTLKKDRERSSVEFERSMQPKLQSIPDARIAFQSQSGGFGRDITVMLAGDDPARLNQAAVKLVNAMGKIGR